MAARLFLPYVSALAIIGGIVFVLHKTEFSKYFAHLFQGRTRTVVTLTVSVLLMFMKTFLDSFFPGATTDLSYGIFCFSLIVLALFCIQFGAMYAAGKDKVKAQEGDVEAIQEFMKRTSGYFDEKLGNEIRQRRIQVALEIMNPVTDVKMPIEDLLRCQGILLDNAIEAAAKEDGRIRIVLLQDAGELYITIANNYDEQPNLGALGKGGYTTKGKGHGTGLSSYRKMVSRCPDCMMRTYLKDNFFVQELHIPV